MKLNSQLNNYTDIKKSNIQNMLFLLKIFSLFFAAIPFFQRYSSNQIENNVFNSMHGLTLNIVAITIIGAVMLLWISLDKAKKNYSYINKIEIPLLFFIFTLAVYSNLTYGNAYKFLYLIIIITYTIEIGGNYGLILAAISSCLILAPGIISDNYASSFDADLALSALFIVIAWTLGYYVKLEHTHIDYLTQITNVDGLTGIYNHRYFHECLEKYYTKDKEQNLPLSLIMIDVDFFKEYNDLFGHRQGDDLLKSIVSVIKDNIREDDLLFRYGGDEFCIILDTTLEEDALKIAERLRIAVRDYHQEGMEHLANKHLSVSVGIASLSDEIDSSLCLIDKADSALYRAKYLRKNRVEAYGAVWHTFKEMSNPNYEDILKYVKTLISVIDAKDKYTYSHTERVAHYSELFADYIHLSTDEKTLLIFSAYLHDLGKINISKDILISDKLLSPEEWNELKAHPTESVTIIEKIDGFEDVIPVVKHHHERYGGGGYPDNLKGEEIPALARMLSVIDSFDAMTHKRPYQKTKTAEEGLNELIRCKGTQFDPHYVDLFVEMMQNVDE
ncbi:MAG: diguanylate cyclase [bacterium]|nr:diguanylate cyclase [bacterium]